MEGCLLTEVLQDGSSHITVKSPSFCPDVRKSSGPVKTQLQLLFLLLTSLQFCSLSTITNLSAASCLLCLILDYFRHMSVLLACMYVLPGPAEVRRFRSS